MRHIELLLLAIICLQSCMAQPSNCPPDSFLDSSSNCILCSSQILNCLRCQLPNPTALKPICTACRKDMTVSSDQSACKTCGVSNCLTCNDEDFTKCEACSASFKLQTFQNNDPNSLDPSTIYRCLPVDCGQVNPKFIFDGLTCSCPTSMALVGTACKSCSAANCLACKSDNLQTCTKCIRSFYLDSTSKACLACPTNCLICHEPTKCLFCKDQYFLDPASFICTSAAPRTISSMALYKSNNGYHFCLFEGCASCSTDGAKCATCQVNYIQSSKSGLCIKCNSGCMACQFTDSTEVSTTCLQCYDGRTTEDNTCEKCEDLNCLSCDRNSRFCTNCSAYTALSSWGECVSCILNCLTCPPDQKTCTSCTPGYFLSETKVCLPCQQNVTFCTGILKFQATAKDCKSDAIWIDKACKPCGPGCLQCVNSPNFCLKCSHDYNLDGNRCSPRVFLPCLDYQINSQDPKVALKVQCTLCLAGYSNLNHFCEKVVFEACTETGTCKQCPLGQGLVSGKCVKCGFNCDVCSFDAKDQLQCTKCTSSFFYDHGKCISCSQSCSYCQNYDNCYKCFEGNYLYIPNQMQTNKLCLLCGSNCIECKGSPYECLRCEKMFTLVGGHCYNGKDVDFQVVFASEVALTSALSATPYALLSGLSELLDNRLEYTSDSFVISSVVEATLKGIILSALPDTIQQSASNINTKLPVAGLKIVSATVFAEGSNKENSGNKDNSGNKENSGSGTKTSSQTQTTSKPASTPLNSMIAISLIGGLVFAAIGVYCYCKNKKKGNAEDGVVENEYGLTGPMSEHQPSSPTEMVDNPGSPKALRMM